jgi:hypothetical protein
MFSWRRHVNKNLLCSIRCALHNRIPHLTLSKRRRVGNRSNKQLETHLCRTNQRLLPRSSSLALLPRLLRLMHSPQTIMTAPIGHPCTRGRLSGANRRSMFMQNMLKGPCRHQSGSCLTGRIVRANRPPVRSKPRACARGFSFGCRARTTAWR